MRSGQHIYSCDDGNSGVQRPAPKGLRRLFLATTIMASCIGGAALAQSSGAGQIEEVIVTAQKTQSTLQKTPLAVSVLSSESLVERGITAVTDLPALSPGLVMGAQSGNNRVFIRGVGLTSVSLG